MNEKHRSGIARRFLTAVAGFCLIAVGVLAVVFGSLSTSDPNDVIGAETEAEVEVCDATEYEGCPQRWAYLFAEDD